MVTCPHPQPRRIRRYSATDNANDGRSNTCTAEATDPAMPLRSPPQPPQATGSTGSLRSGLATRAKPLPRCPGCPPCLRRGSSTEPAGPCSPGWSPARLSTFALALAPRPSLLGGWEEFEESRSTRRRSAASSTRIDSINDACSLNDAACRTTRAASSSYEGGADDSDTRAVKPDQAPDVSTDTPRLTRGSDCLPPASTRTARLHGSLTGSDQ